MVYLFRLDNVEKLKGKIEIDLVSKKKGDPLYYLNTEE